MTGGWQGSAAPATVCATGIGAAAPVAAEVVPAEPRNVDRDRPTDE